MLQPLTSASFATLLAESHKKIKAAPDLVAPPMRNALDLKQFQYGVCQEVSERTLVLAKSTFTLKPFIVEICKADRICRSGICSLFVADGSLCGIGKHYTRTAEFQQPVENVRATMTSDLIH